MFDNNEIKESQVITPNERVEGCKLVKIVTNDDKSITWEFIQVSTGDLLKQREFLPTRQEGQDDDKFKNNIKLTIGRVAHMARAFMDEATFKSIKVEDPNNLQKVEANWIAYNKMTIEVVKKADYTSEAYKGIDLKGATKATELEVALKVVYKENKRDAKYYSSFPAVPAFISSPIHPKIFKSDPAYDIYTIPSAVPDAQHSTQAGSDVNTAASPTASAEEPEW